MDFSFLLPKQGKGLPPLPKQRHRLPIERIANCISLTMSCLSHGS
jgi:hypothetical protein